MRMDLAVINTGIIEELKKIETKLPANYSIENALKSAAMAIDSTVDKNKRPAREVCSEDSIKRSLMNMAIQGLNPSKNQCYFQIYGQQLTLIRSYMGSAMVAKAVDDQVTDIRAEIVYENDKFSFEVINGLKVVKQHEQTLQTIEKDKIAGAYAFGINRVGHVIYSNIMPISEIHHSWKSSKQRVFLSNGGLNPDSVHGKYPGEMAKRTVINRLCKMIINTSTDENLISAAMVSDEEKDMDVIISEEVSENAGTIAIDFSSKDDNKPINKEISMVPMATKDHFNMIMKLADDLNCKDKVIADINTMFSKDISKISELTADEAEKYIDTLDQKLVKRGLQEVEDNLVDEPPSWAQEV